MSNNGFLYWINESKQEWKAKATSLDSNLTVPFPNGYFVYGFSLSSEVNSRGVGSLHHLIAECSIKSFPYSRDWFPFNLHNLPPKVFFNSGGGIEGFLHPEQILADMREYTSDYWRINFQGNGFSISEHFENAQSSTQQNINIDRQIYKVITHLIFTYNFNALLTSNSNPEFDIYLEWTNLNGRRLIISKSELPKVQSKLSQTQLLIAKSSFDSLFLVSSSRFNDGLPEVSLLQEIMNPFFNYVSGSEPSEAVYQANLKEYKKKNT